MAWVFWAARLQIAGVYRKIGNFNVPPINMEGLDDIQNVGAGAGADKSVARCAVRLRQARRKGVWPPMKARNRIHNILGRSAESYPIGR